MADKHTPEDETPTTTPAPQTGKRPGYNQETGEFVV